MTSGPSPLWYATRATGVIALVLLTATVVLGITGTARFATPRWPRLVTSGLHRNLSLLSVGFVAAHVLTTVLDSYAPIGWTAAIVPFTSAYRTLWLGLGTVACDLLLAVTATSLLRARLGYRTWRAVHWLSYACWPVALWHALGTGTDSKLPWLLALDAICVTAVACALFWRLSLARRTPRLTARIVVCAVVPVATAVFVLAGPLQPGWAKRSGTPPAQLAGKVTPDRAQPATGPAARPPAGASFTGRAVRTPGPAAGEVTITVTGQTSPPAPQRLVIALRGTPDGTGVDLSGGTVSVRPDRSAGATAGYQGPVVSLNGDLLVADLKGPGDSAVRATITLAVHGSTASGRLTVATGGGE
jgi:methionine sulfoxide reductase heme-binding subunit